LFGHSQVTVRQKFIENHLCQRFRTLGDARTVKMRVHIVGLCREDAPEGRRDEGYREERERRHRPGGHSIMYLPKIGIRGNTHFPMSDLNNREIADLMSKFLKEKGLD
jgi:hypothetical protein